MADEYIMLIKVEPGANNNKFYELNMGDDSIVHARWGRVGLEGQKAIKGNGLGAFERVKREKERKGYVPTGVAGSAKAEQKDSLAKMSVQALCGDGADPTIVELISYLVDVNAHEITKASGGKLNVVDGQVTTPLGLLTTGTINNARVVLSDIGQALAKGRSENERAELVVKYMTLVPQNVGMKRGWDKELLSTPDDVQQQSTFLDQLEASVEFSRKQSKAAEEKDTDLTDLFRYRVALADKKIVTVMQKEFKNSANDFHGSVSSSKVKRVYTLGDVKDTERFEVLKKDLGNPMEVWHGSRAFNVLSIMSKGLMVPGRNASNVTGRMFGDGIYFSNQSTKSANYSRGGVWSSGRDDRWFMLRCEVVTGWQYRPGSYSYTYDTRWNDILDGKKKDSKTGRVYNSINVLPGSGGVRNHELIVPGPDYVTMKYLVEFKG